MKTTAPAPAPAPAHAHAHARAQAPSVAASSSPPPPPRPTRGIPEAFVKGVVGVYAKVAQIDKTNQVIHEQRKVMDRMKEELRVVEPLALSPDAAASESPAANTRARGKKKAKAKPKPNAKTPAPNHKRIVRIATSVDASGGDSEAVATDERPKAVVPPTNKRKRGAPSVVASETSSEARTLPKSKRKRGTQRH